MPIILKNNASSTLATAISASDTGIVVADGSKFPSLGASDYFYATLVSSGGTTEVVKVTARVGNSLTVVRAQDGSSAAGFASGALLEMRVNAASVTDLVDEHDQAAEISIADAGNYYTSTNVEGALQEIGAAGGVTRVPATDQFTGNGSTINFTLSVTPLSIALIDVYIDGVYQNKNTFSFAGAVLTFSEAPPLGAKIEVLTNTGFGIAGIFSASAVNYNQGGTGAVTRTVQARLRDYVSVKDFGAVGDGVTDDTAFIQAALDYADTGSNQSSVVTVFIPAGTYIHTGITIPGGVNVMGDGRTSTTLFLKNSTNPVQSVKLESSRASISKVTIDGNRNNNSSGIGLNADNSVAAGNSAFCYIEDLDIQNTAGTGCIVTNGNMAHLKNVSITRCTTGLIAERCTQLTMTNVDIAKFTVAGFVMQGSPAQNVVVWNGGFMEATVDTPTAGAPFIHLKNMRSTDALYIAGLWCNGHFTDEAFDTTGLKIEDPLYVDNVTIDGTVFYNVKAAGTYVGVANTEIGLVDARGISTVGGGGSFTRQMGVLTQASYNFDFFTNEKSLTVSGTTNEFIVPTGGPIEIQEMSMLVTEAFAGAGNGALNFGVNGTGTAFGSGLVLTDPTTLGTVVDFTSSLTSKKSSLSFDKITFAAPTPLATTGKARFKVRGIVY